MFRTRTFLVSAALLVLAHAGRAQSRPAPVPADSAKQLTINITLPKSVTVIRDCASILFSRKQVNEKVSDLMERRRQKTAPPAVQVKVPRNRFTRALGIVD